MGQCYSTFLAAHIRDEQGLVKALQGKIANARQECVNYSTEGMDTTTMKGLMGVLFAAHQNGMDYSMDEGKRIVECSSCFDARYGWETVLHEWFGVMAAFVGEGSYLYVDVDEGDYYLTVANGNVVESDDIHKCALSLYK